ncbi:unnamed protein product [Ectocarpus sp. 12 AP-2014]
MPRPGAAAVEDMDVSQTEEEQGKGEGEGEHEMTVAEEEEEEECAGETEQDGGGPAAGETQRATTAPTAAEAAPPQQREEPPAPARLLITKMEMENFKSYGGLREIGPFHKCFSSIVGPNGSGKSNVIDAMLFVFGKRAKKLRLNKLGELIHRSDTYPNLDFCRVSVHFVDILDVSGSEDDYEEVPGTELVVTRTAYKDNHSKYEVDGKTKTFKEVGALLRKRGVDLDNNRFLILQGEVEQIAMMKPKGLTEHEDGLLEYLEDIIGSDRFVEAAEEAARRVEELNDQRTEKLNRLKLAEKEKDSLEGDKQKAYEFLRLDAAIRTKQNILYQSNMAHAATNVEKVMEKEEERKERLRHEREKLASTLKELEETKKVHKRVSGEHQKLTAQMKRTKEEFNEYERKDIQHQEGMKHFKEQTKKLEAAIKKDTKRSKDSLARAAELEGSLDGLRRAVGQTEARKKTEDEALEEVNESLKGKTAELRGKLEGEQERVRPVREETDALRNKVDTCKCEIKLVRESTESAKKRLKDAEAALEKLLEKAEADKGELSHAKKDSRSMETQISQAEEKVAEAQRQVSTATEAMGRAVAAAEEAKASRESAAGKTGALRALLEASSPGGALHGAGICGRLGDLGAIRAEYDVAVSSCTGQMDNIVVQSAEGATACVEYLREHRLGRLSFIILEKLGHLENAMGQRFQAPPGCPRLFDLLEVSEPRFRTAFYLALRDTLVAPDMKTAMAAAYQNGRTVHRVVTADGKLIDRSGAMTGGGNSTKRGAMRIIGRAGGSAASGAGSGGAGIVSAARAEELAVEARRAEDAVKAARLKKKDAEECLKKLHARSKQLQTLIPKLEMRLQGVGASEEQYREQMEALQAQCKLTPEAEAQLKKLTKDLTKDENDLAKVSASLDKAEEAVKALQTAILEVGGERLKKAVKRADAASKALDEASDALNRATVEGEGERKKGEKVAKDADRKTKELEAVREKAQKAKDGFAGMEEKAFEVLKAFEAAEAEVNTKAEELREIAESYEKAKSLADKIRGVEVDISHQLQEYAKSINENKTKLKHWTGELKKLRKTHKKEAEDWGLEDEDEHGVSDDDDDEGSEDERGEGVTDEDRGDGGVEESKGGWDDDDDEEEEEEESEGKSTKSAKAKSDGTKKRDKAAAAGRRVGVLPDLDAEELDDVHSREDLKLKISEMEAERKAMESSVNLPALEQYRKREEEYHGRVQELEEATVARKEARE